MAENESKGFYKLSWLQRIGFGSGDMAQNLIYQTISIWLLFFYTNVFGLDPGVAAVMFLVVRLVDVLWDPIVGTIVDKGNPKWGKYRSWLILGGIPLVALAILCFWNGFSGSLIYAYVTYVGMSMCYTLVNVPYGALNASLSRDTEEITILTSTRMFMANLGALCVKSLPLIIAIFAPKVLNPETGKMTAVYNTPEAAPAWFITMTIFALVGLLLLFFCFSQCKERVVMDQKESANVKVSDLWMEFVRNKPLRVVAFFFITAFAMMSVGTAAHHPVHVARHHPGLHLHAARPRHQAQDRQEGHVLPVPRRRHPRYGHDVHLRVHPRHQEQLRPPVHRPVREVHRYHHRHGLHVGPRPGGHLLR